MIEAHYDLAKGAIGGYPDDNGPHMVGTGLAYSQHDIQRISRVTRNLKTS